MKFVSSLSLFAQVAPALGAALRQNAFDVSPGANAATTVPLVEHLPPRDGSPPGVTHVKTRYGPFKAAPYNKKSLSSILTSEGGMSMSQQNSVPIPCTGCTYTYIRADMVYADGTTANVNSGIWLHHMVMTQMPPKTTGKWTFTLPSPFYEIGNERNAIDHKGAGVYVHKNATVSLMTDLMNMVNEEKTVYIVVDTEFLPGQPEGYLDTNVIPTDSTNGNPNPPKGRTTYVTNGTVPSFMEGKILSVYGHLHDGGLHTEIAINGKLVCDSKCLYASDLKDPTYAQSDPKLSGLVNLPGPLAKIDRLEHIGAFSNCYPGGYLNKGDLIRVTGYYNYTEHPAMLNLKGEPDEIMAIGMIYLGVPMPKDA